jgi:hypothetical protein
VPGLAPGRYAIDLVERLVIRPEPGEWQPQLISDRFVAARIRLRRAQVASHELMAVAPLGVPFVVGLPASVGAAKYDDLTVEARAQAHEEGVTVVARRGSRLEPARSGEMAVFAVVARQIWLGRDGDGRVVEVAGYGDRRAAVLRKNK